MDPSVTYIHQTHSWYMPVPQQAIYYNVLLFEITAICCLILIYHVMYDVFLNFRLH